jgi:hypothetical protein
MLSLKGRNPDNQVNPTKGETSIFVYVFFHLTLRNKCLYSGKVGSFGGTNRDSLSTIRPVPLFLFSTYNRQRKKRNVS